jgi:hypothetical protein
MRGLHGLESEVANDPPDDRSLVLYETGSRLHASTLAWTEDALIGVSCMDDEERIARVLSLREQARRGLRVMELLAAAWHRDHAERRGWRDEAEKLLRRRYEELAARPKQQYLSWRGSGGRPPMD